MVIFFLSKNLNMIEFQYMKKTFSIKNLFNQAWSDYKANWKLFLLVGIIFLLVGMIGNIGSTFDPHTQMITQSPFIGVIGWLLQMFITLGFIRFLLNIVDGNEYKIEDLFKGANSFSHFLYFIVVSLLYSALVGFGVILLIIPGIVLGIGLLFAQYIVAEEKAGIFESLKESWNLTKGYKWRIFGLMLLIALFNILGLLAFVVGLVVTIPMTYLIYVRLYRTLGQKQRVTSDEDDIEVVDILDGNQEDEE